MKTSKELHEHFIDSRPLILESVNSMIEKNYEKLMNIWNKTENPIPIKKARKITVLGRDYYYIVSSYVENKNLEWDTLIYTFDDSDTTDLGDGIKKYNKDLIFFNSPDFKMPFPGLNGTLRFTSRFLEMYGFMYGEEDYSVYDISERWVRRNSCPLFVVTSEPIEKDNPRGCNVIGKDFYGDGVCIARIGKEDEEVVKFMSYYPEDVLDDLQNSDESISMLLSTFREIVKPAIYKNPGNTMWPNKFMLNEYYD